MECFFLEKRFPAGPPVRRLRVKGEELGLERVFCSNVSAAVRRDALLAHPFEEQLIMSEDQQVSRDLMLAGYVVAYVPDSVVIHSHNYTLAKVFQRYFDSVYSLTQIFPKHDMGESASMGFRYLFREAWHMARHYPAWLPYYLCYTACKSAGTLMGHFAEKMPRAWAQKMSLHRYYWSA